MTSRSSRSRPPGRSRRGSATRRRSRWARRRSPSAACSGCFTETVTKGIVSVLDRTITVQDESTGQPQHLERADPDRRGDQVRQQRRPAPRRDRRGHRHRHRGLEQRGRYGWLRDSDRRRRLADRQGDRHGAPAPAKRRTPGRGPAMTVQTGERDRGPGPGLSRPARRAASGLDVVAVLAAEGRHRHPLDRPRRVRTSSVRAAGILTAIGQVNGALRDLSRADPAGADVMQPVAGRRRSAWTAWPLRTAGWGFATVWLLLAHGIATTIGYALADGVTVEEFRTLTTTVPVRPDGDGERRPVRPAAVTSIHAARRRLSYQTPTDSTSTRTSRSRSGSTSSSSGRDFMHDQLAAIYWIGAVRRTAALMVFRIGSRSAHRRTDPRGQGGREGPAW